MKEKINSKRTWQGRPEWNYHDYFLGMPKTEMIVMIILSSMILYLGMKFYPSSYWFIVIPTNAIFAVVRRRQSQRKFDQFMGRRNLD